MPLFGTGNSHVRAAHSLGERIGVIPRSRGGSKKGKGNRGGGEKTAKGRKTFFSIERKEVWPRRASSGNRMASSLSHVRNRKKKPPQPEEGQNPELIDLYTKTNITTNTKKLRRCQHPLQKDRESRCLTKKSQQASVHRVNQSEMGGGE